MKIQTMFAIYFLFWFISLFCVLPFAVRTTDEGDVERVPGQADGAPAHFDVWQTIRRTSLVAGIVFALFYANYVYGWVTIHSFDGLFNPPASALK